MNRIRLKEIYSDISAFDGKTVTVAGWVRTIRDSKAFGFIELNDGSCFKNMQIVFERESLSNYDEIAHENVGASLIIEGKVIATPENKQPCEIKAQKISDGGGVRSRLSVAEKAPFRGISAGNRLFKTQNEPFQRGVPRP